MQLHFAKREACTKQDVNDNQWLDSHETETETWKLSSFDDWDCSGQFTKNSSVEWTTDQCSPQQSQLSHLPILQFANVCFVTQFFLNAERSHAIIWSWWWGSSTQDCTFYPDMIFQGVCEWCQFAISCHCLVTSDWRKLSVWARRCKSGLASASCDVTCASLNAIIHPQGYTMGEKIGVRTRARMPNKVQNQVQNLLSTFKDAHLPSFFCYPFQGMLLSGPASFFRRQQNRWWLGRFPRQPHAFNLLDHPYIDWLILLSWRSTRHAWSRVQRLTNPS